MVEQFNGLNSKSSRGAIWEATQKLLKENNIAFDGSDIPNEENKKGDFWQQKKFNPKTTKPAK